MAEGVYERRWHADASLTIGHEDNHLTMIQINYSEITANVEDVLGVFGGLHIDSTDDPTLFTCVLFVGNQLKNYFLGRFCITSVKSCGTTAPLSALEFKGTHCHLPCAIGPYPANLFENSPLRYTPPLEIGGYKLPVNTPEGRISIVNYPKVHLTRYQSKNLRPEMYEDGIIATLGTKRNVQECRMREHMKLYSEPLSIFLDNQSLQFPKQHPDGQIKYFPMLSPDHWCNRFKWVNDAGEIEYPRRRIALVCCAVAGKRDSEYEALTEAWESINYGKEFPDFPEKTIHNKKVGEEKVTHVDYVSTFGAEIDEVPGNLEWKNPGRQRALAFLEARLKRQVHGRFVVGDQEAAFELLKRVGRDCFQISGRAFY